MRDLDDAHELENRHVIARMLSIKCSRLTAQSLLAATTVLMLKF